MLHNFWMLFLYKNKPNKLLIVVKRRLQSLQGGCQSVCCWSSIQKARQTTELRCDWLRVTECLPLPSFEAADWFVCSNHDAHNTILLRSGTVGKFPLVSYDSRYSFKKNLTSVFVPKNFTTICRI